MSGHFPQLPLGSDFMGLPPQAELSASAMLRAAEANPQVINILQAITNNTFGVVPARFEARLTGTSGTPVTQTDVTAIATLYLAPYNGATIALYTGGSWTYYTLTEKSLALTSYIVGVCYDIYVYDSAGVVTLESVAFKKVASSSSPTAGSNKTLNLADTATLAVGMDVTVKDGSASEIARINTVTASTSIVVDTLANSYTTPDVYGYLARTTAQVLQDGIIVQSGATNKRFVGTIRIWTTAGQTEDSVARRYISNYYNAVPRPMQAFPTTDTWNYTTGTLRQANADKANQIDFVSCRTALQVIASGLHHANNATSGIARESGLGINATATSTGLMAWTTPNGSQILPLASSLNEMVGIGRYYVALLERGDGSGTTTTWYGDGGVPGFLRTGVIGSVLG